MKKYFILFFSIFFLLILSSCSGLTNIKNTTASTNPTTIATQNPALKKPLLREPVDNTDTDYSTYQTESYLKFVDSVNAFSNKFTAEYYTKYNNDINSSVSPISLYMALSLAAECASGSTREELLSALNVTYEELVNNISYLYDLCNDEKYITNEDLERVLCSKRMLTNSIWLDESIEFKAECLDTLASKYKCYSYQVGFFNDNNTANELIRQFVKEKTNGLIDQNFQLGIETAFSLINTFYMKDVWNYNGNDLALSSDNYDFKNYDNTISSIKLLISNYNEGKAYIGSFYSSFSVLTASNYKLTFILPNDDYSISEIFKNDVLNDISTLTYVTEDESKNEAYHTRCLFPEFETNCNKDISSLLNEKFNLLTFFTKNCDMKNISDDDIYCDSVTHVTKLKVDKTGMEGAAVTIIQMATSSMPEPVTDIYFDFIINKAFGFILNYNNIQLFTGIVNKI